MNKIFVLSLLLGILGIIAFSTGAVIAQTPQNVTANVTTAVDVTLQTTSIDYGAISPGSDSDPRTTTFAIGANNNVNFTIDITLQAGSNSLFENLFYDLNVDPDFEAQIGNATFHGVDTDEADTTSFPSILRVPNGFPPVSGATGVVVYTITGAP